MNNAGLIGSVTNADQQQTAVRIAQTTPAVPSVINQLIIENGRVAQATPDQARPRNQLRPQNQPGPQGLQQPQGMSVQASLAEPIVSRMINRQWEANMANLKELLEAQS